MKGNFHDHLNRKNGGKTVVAWGWIRWSEITDSSVTAVRVGATVAQHEDTASEKCGTCFAPAPYSRPSDNSNQRWECELTEDEGKSYEQGAARAGGVFVSSNPSWIFPWGDDVTLD
jgi:hypothetical protein